MFSFQTHSDLGLVVTGRAQEDANGNPDLYGFIFDIDARFSGNLKATYEQIDVAVSSVAIVSTADPDIFGLAFTSNIMSRSGERMDSASSSCLLYGERNLNTDSTLSLSWEVCVN